MLFQVFFSNANAVLQVEGTASSGDKPWAQRREAGDGAEWADELRMKEELRRARVEDDLSKLKKDLGKM